LKYFQNFQKDIEENWNRKREKLRRKCKDRKKYNRKKKDRKEERLKRTKKNERERE